jgi:hypothetical protein
MKSENDYREEFRREIWKREYKEGMLDRLLY